MIFIPEIFLAFSALLFILIGPFIRKNAYLLVTYLTLLTVIIAQFLVYKDIFHFESIFNNFFVIDSFGSFIKSLLLIGTAIVLYIFIIANKNTQLNRIEFPILILLSLTGMMLMVASNDILSLFLSMELQSLALYILVAFAREDRNSSEAGVKLSLIHI